LATIVGQVLPKLHPDHPLDQALRMIGESPMLPVVHRADYESLLGILTLEDIIRAYRSNGVDTLTESRH
jgi:CBS domain-containing protein